MTKLIARRPELELLEGLLRESDVRVVTLIGTGGVGKTRLSLELARRVEAEYRDGAVLVELERLTDPALVAAEIAGALGHREGTDGPGADGLPRYLQDKEMLVVIDNFEHLLPAAALVSELLVMAPRVRVLVSSRTALRIRGERLVTVEPLALPSGGSEDQIARSPAVALFVDRARAADPELRLGPEDHRTVASICRGLDGLPLAIELAASRCQVLTPAQIHDQLSQPLSIGERALRDLPDRQQTLHATIAWSYELLTASAQTALRGAGAFLGGFTPAALQAVTGRAPGTDLSEHREASLVRRQADPGRFELLELVRAFALDACRAAGESAHTRARHRQYFTGLVAPVSARFDAGAAAGELSALLRADHANLRAAFADAIQAGDQESATGLALGLRPLWIGGNLRQESGELAERLLGRFSIAGQQELALLRIVAALELPAAKWQQRFAEVIERARRHGVHSVAVAALWFVARYAAGIDPERRPPAGTGGEAPHRVGHGTVAGGRPARGDDGGPGNNRARTPARSGPTQREGPDVGVEAFSGVGCDRSAPGRGRHRSVTWRSPPGTPPRPPRR